MIEINQKALEEEIYSLEKGYVISKIALIKSKTFINQINKELETTTNKVRRKELENLIGNNEMQNKWHIESLENVENILNEVYQLRTK